MELTKELKSKGWLAIHSALKTASNNHVMINNFNCNKQNLNNYLPFKSVKFSLFVKHFS